MWMGVQKYKLRPQHTVNAFFLACILRDIIIKQNNEVMCTSIKFVENDSA